MIEAIAFDFGQVIGYFDHGRTLARLAPYSDKSPAELYEAIYDTELEHEFESGRIDAPEFLRRVHGLCGLRCDEAFLAAAVADIFWPNQELAALIPRLKQRYRLVLGSNTNPVHSRVFLADFADTLRHFDAQILSFEIGARKPDREFFEQVIQAAQCPPECCVFVDDMPGNVAGAQACGLRGVVYNDMKRLLAELSNLGVAPDIAGTL